MPSRIRPVKLDVISMNVYPISPVINARSNSTGRIGCKSIEITLPVKGIRLVELGVNPLRSKAFNRQWIYTQIDQHLSQWIYTQFDRLNWV